MSYTHVYKLFLRKYLSNWKMIDLISFAMILLMMTKRNREVNVSDMRINVNLLGFNRL